MVRKAQCHAGWDWGLCLMVLGVYGRAEAHALRRGAHRARGHPPEAPRQRQGDGHRRGRDRRGQGADDPGHLHLRRRDRLGQRCGDPRRRQGGAVDRPRQAGAVVAGRPRRAAAPRRVVAIPGDRVERRVGLRKLEVVNRAGRQSARAVLPRQRPRHLLQGRQLDPRRRAPRAHHPRPHPHACSAGGATPT